VSKIVSNVAEAVHCKSDAHQTELMILRVASINHSLFPHELLEGSDSRDHGNGLCVPD